MRLKAEINMQEGDESFKAIQQIEGPFRIEKEVELPSSLRLQCRAILTEIADADKRCIEFEDIFEIKPSGRLRSASKPIEVVHTFVTQVSNPRAHTGRKASEFICLHASTGLTGYVMLVTSFRSSPQKLLDCIVHH